MYRIPVVELPTVRSDVLTCARAGSLAALRPLKGAAEHGRLGSATYGRLNGSLMAYGLGYAAVAAAAALNASLATTLGIW